MLDLLSSDVCHDINQGGREVGVKLFDVFLENMALHYEEQVSELCILTSATHSARASAEFIISGKYLKSQEGLPPARSQTYRIAVGAFFEIKNDKISRISNYYNLPEWINSVTNAG